MSNYDRQNPLKMSAEFLKGVGPVRAEALRTVGIHTFEDVLEVVPRRYLDRSDVRKISEINEDETVTVIGDVSFKQLIERGKKRLTVRIYDGTGILEAVWFNQPRLFSKMFHEGQTVAFSGKVGRYKYWQIIHPDFDVISDQKEPLNTGQLIPLYPSTADLKKAWISNYVFRKILFLAFKKYGHQIPETLPQSLIRQYLLFSRSDAFRQMHFPDSHEALHQVERRFKYEELFYLQLLMALRKHFYQSPAIGLKIPVNDTAFASLKNLLPFQLTGAQERVLGEIRNDVQSGLPMNRLVQGDVGSGKTAVAMLAMQMVISAGYQAAIMAPTEILAQQHFANISNLLKNSGIRVNLLIGSLSEKEKKAVHRRIAEGKVDLIVGTHALIQEKVIFENLGMVVIDEQHRFGVMQRGDLIEKGKTPHVLVMTATPIPRTLALTIYGDLDVSVIDELPPGRHPVKTFHREEDRLPLIWDFLRQHIEKGEQAYIVYPLVEESEKLDLKAATETYQHLQADVFPEVKMALIHGRQKAPEKEKIMNDFKNGRTQILVSTTVIEVGVDVPNATIMVIEHADRFGLSQLHQLRGRVGRGKNESFCILVTAKDISDIAGERMGVMSQTNDGFVIAEEDLRLRGSGEFFGTRQSGMPDLKFANLLTDQKIIEIARKDAFAIVQRDPHLRLPENEIIRERFKDKFVDKFQMPNIA
ncbi:MAG: ATP-dependent DNA helicase RecG [Calditrichae bacterium]|nr:ATP-dependent DNA helicase RecG [Calditrichia bacterium]